MRPSFLLAVALVAALPSTAGAQLPPYQGARVLGLGGALRGAATGDAALTLNPSGISLARSYVVDGGYEYAGVGEEHDAHVSITDSTSGYNVGGGLYYTYTTASPEAGVERSGHEGGLALSFPFADKVFVGGTIKYLRLERQAADEERNTRGFTFDAGLTVRPVSFVSIGLAGYNLVDKDDPRVPFSAGGGIALAPTPDLLIGVDAVLDLGKETEDRTLVHVMGGVEYLFGKVLGLRAGGGRRGDGAGFLAGGLSAVAEIGAVDVGLQQELGGRKELIIGAAARLFVPSP